MAKKKVAEAYAKGAAGDSDGTENREKIAARRG